MAGLLVTGVAFLVLSMPQPRVADAGPRPAIFIGTASGALLAFVYTRWRDARAPHPHALVRPID